MPHHLTAREQRLLEILYPDGSVAVGLRVGALLAVKGYVKENRSGRYELTRKGIMAVIAARRQRKSSQNGTASGSSSIGTARG